jgi:hypothetical protein
MVYMAIKLSLDTAIIIGDVNISTLIKELSERAHIPHAPHIDRSNAKFLK